MDNSDAPLLCAVEVAAKPKLVSTGSPEGQPACSRPEAAVLHRKAGAAFGTRGAAQQRTSAPRLPSKDSTGLAQRGGR